MAPINQRLAQARDYLRRNGLNIVKEIVVNFAGPVVVYDLAKPYLGEVGALMASSGPPIAWSVVEFIRSRRVDAISILVLTGIALSILAFFGGGSARFLQLRERLVTAFIGLLFIGSAVIRRPLIFYLARATMRRRSAEEADMFETLRGNASFQHTMLVMTLVWGVALVAEAALCAVLVFQMSIRDYLLISRPIGYGTFGSLFAWTFWYGGRQRRKGEALRAAAEAEAAARPAPVPSASPSATS